MSSSAISAFSLLVPLKLLVMTMALSRSGSARRHMNYTGLNLSNAFLMSKPHCQCAQPHGPLHDNAAPELTCQLHLPIPLMDLEVTTTTATLIHHPFPLLHIDNHLLLLLLPATTNTGQTTILAWLDAALSTRSERWDLA